MGRLASGDLHVAFDPTLRYYARGDSHGAVEVRTAGDDQEVVGLRGPDAEVRRLQFSPDGRDLAVVQEGEAGSCWSVWEWAEGRRLAGQDVTAFGLDFSADGRTVAVGDRGQGVVSLYALPSGEQTRQFASRSRSPPSPSTRLSPGWRFRAAWRSEVEILSLAEPAVEHALVVSLIQPDGAVSLAWSPDGGLLAAAGRRA